MRKCVNCGAVETAKNAKFCSFCGAGMPEPQRAAPPSPFGDVEARLEAARAHPGYERATRRRPSITGVGMQLGAGVFFGLFFAAVAGFMAVAAGSNGAPGIFLLVPVAFVVVGIGIAVVSARKVQRFRSAETRTRVALVVDERTQVRGGGKNSSASTSYYVTLEFERGRRKEYEVQGRIAGSVTRGDVGVAHVRDEYLLDFDRLPV